MSRDPYREIRETELRQWPGAQARLVRRRNHMVVELRLGDQRRLVVSPTTPSDHRGALNHRTWVRRALREMAGASR